MAKRKSKEKVGRVVIVSKEDNMLLKQYFIDAEEIGCTLSNGEICSQIFSIGLHTQIKTMAASKINEMEGKQ